MRWLTNVMWAQLVLAGVSLAGMVFDARELLGVSVWLKPLKFELSIFVYLLTLGWMIRFYPSGFRPAERVARIAAVAMAVEIFFIVMQASRGVTSHFNESTGFDLLVFNVMGLFILLNSYAGARLAWMYWRSPPPSPPAPGLLAGIRWGLVLLLAGSLEAAAMLARSAHTVGAADGGAGLPLVNWSLAHGDLRAAHAMGLHGMQALPLTGWLVDRFQLPRPAALVSLAALLYTGIFLYLLTQALAGRPVLG
jgi:hypothetical protein